MVGIEGCVNNNNDDENNFLLDAGRRTDAQGSMSAVKLGTRSQLVNAAMPDQMVSEHQMLLSKLM